MIKVSALYPNEGGKKFDMGYYFNKHIPMLQQKLGAACKRVAVEQGLGGVKPAGLTSSWSPSDLKPVSGETKTANPQIPYCPVIVNQKP